MSLVELYQPRHPSRARAYSLFSSESLAPLRPRPPPSERAWDSWCILYGAHAEPATLCYIRPERCVTMQNRRVINVKVANARLRNARPGSVRSDLVAISARRFAVCRRSRDPAEREFHVTALIGTELNRRVHRHGTHQRSSRRARARSRFHPRFRVVHFLISFRVVRVARGFTIHTLMWRCGNGRLPNGELRG